MRSPMYSCVVARLSGLRLAFGAAALAIALLCAHGARAQTPPRASQSSLAAPPPPPVAPSGSALAAVTVAPAPVPAASAPGAAGAIEPPAAPEPPPVAAAATHAPVAPSADAPVTSSAPPPSALRAQIAPAPSASAGASAGPAVARLGDAAVFTVFLERGGKAPEARAGEASEALKRAFNADRTAPVTRRQEGDVIVVLAGQIPIIQLSQADATAAGETSLDVYAASISGKIHEALDAESKRAVIAKSIFSVSLVVFFGLIAFYLIGKLGQFAETAREFLDNRPDRELSIKVQKIEVVRPATLRSSAVMALSIGKWLGQAAIAYAWLVVALSLFEATRNYTQRLTGFVLGPLSQFMERLAGALPLLVVAAIAALAVFVLVRFVGLFFVSVARGETPLPWLPADLAAPTSALLRSAIVVAALVFAAPVVTGDPNGALVRAGAIILMALGLASTPLLATSLVGVTVLFGRRLRLGEFAEVNGTVARISAINLLEVRLIDAHRSELRVPHLLCLFRPFRVLGTRPRLSIDVPVSSASPQQKVREVLSEAAKKCGHDPKLDLLRFDVDCALYRLSALCDSLEGRRILSETAFEDLSAAGIALGRAPRRAVHE
ncbi:MAG: mechanosensitive ion channel family protein [Pseudomonadota bacterium]